MPRHIREKSETGIYHIMLRGINQQQIFEDDEDYEQFIEILKECKEISSFEIYAYCLMGNHIHLLIKEQKEDISQIIKRVGTRFVYWYNTKYQRAGHLFQDRFRSEPVNDQEYFNTVLVYIHNNPVKAGLCKTVADYPFSSYNEYVKKAGLIDTSFVFGYWTTEQFISVNQQEISSSCMDVEDASMIRVTDQQAKVIIKRISHCDNATDFQNLEIKQRDKYLKKLKEKGLSIRQISRLTGISYYLIQKA